MANFNTANTANTPNTANISNTPNISEVQFDFSQDTELDPQTSEAVVKEFYTLIDVKTPKRLLPREIALYTQLTSDMQKVIDLNANLKEKVAKPSILQIEEPMVVQVKKWVRDWFLIFIAITSVCTFAQYCLDTDRQVLILENQKLSKSNLNEENKLLKEDIHSLQEESKRRKCLLF